MMAIRLIIINNFFQNNCFFKILYVIIKKRNILRRKKVIMKEITYRIYADESVSNGKYFSNFYGRSISKFIRYKLYRK